MYDLCIVGAGLIGSSAAKHASKQSRVLLIGPEEPQDRRQTEIHGAYFDEARAAAQFFSHGFWARAFKDSRARFEAIIQYSGLEFFHETGFLAVGPASGNYIRNGLQNVEALGITKEVLSMDQMLKSFPYLSMRSCDIGVFVRNNAGWLNPRTLRQAQMRIASANGCHIVSDIVEQIQSLDGNLEIMTESGSVYHAKRVLLCTGAFTQFRRLLPSHLCPDVSLVAQSVLFAELGPDDLEALRAMPSMVIVDSDISDLQKKSCYVLPPVKYPDGKMYLKIGHGSQYESILRSHQEVQAWYTNPVPDDIKSGLIEILRANFPSLKPLSFHCDSCVTTNTANRLPFIDMATPSIGVVIGGNGYAAKSCDQLGKLGVDMVLGNEWSPEYHRDMLRCKWKVPESHL